MGVNTETRLMTLKDADGVYHVLHVPPQVSRIDQIKIGDKVAITEVSSALIGLTPTDAGMPIAMDTSFEVDRDAGSKPGGTMTETLTVTGEIIGINTDLPERPENRAEFWTKLSRFIGSGQGAINEIRELSRRAASKMSNFRRPYCEFNHLRSLQPRADIARIVLFITDTPISPTQGGRLGG
jgi:hypothetical protein